MTDEKFFARLKRFYENEFSLSQLRRVIDFSSFKNREFGFQFPKRGFVRNLSFKRPSEFREFLVVNIPLHAYVGAVYDEPPTGERPIHKIAWKSRELVFDIDLDEYDNVRPCECRGADQVCSKCWSLISTAIFFLHETLEIDFGFKKLQWVFTGRRGVHCWVLDRLGNNLNSEQRAAIIDYLSLLKGGQEPNSFRVERIRDPDWVPDFKKRIFDWVIRSFLKEASLEELLEVGFSETKAKRIFNSKNAQTNALYLDPRLLQSNKVSTVKLYNNMIFRRYPRIDHKVTIDLRRLLRLPGTVHGKSRKVARLLSPSEILNFDPLDEPNIFNSA